MPPPRSAPQLAPLTEPPSQTEIQQYLDVHDEKVKLKRTVEEQRLEILLLIDLMAIHNPNSQHLIGKHKNIIAIRLGISTSLVSTRYHAMRKRIVEAHKSFHKDLRRLDEAALRGGFPPERVSDMGRIVRDESRAAQNRSSNTDTRTKSHRDTNILRPVKCTQGPDDDIVVRVGGQTLNQRGLALWYRNSDMRAESRRIFQAKNIEINQMRRIHRRG